MQKHLNTAKRKSSDIKINSDLALVLINIAIQILTFAVFCIFSFFLNLKYNFFYPVSLLGLAVGTFVTGIVTGQKKRQNGLINGILFSAPSNVIILVASLIINKFLFDYSIIISLIVALLFSALGGIVSVNFKRKPKIRR